MATVKVTITLEEEDLATIRKLVAEGTAASVSGFAQHAVRVALHDVSGWGAMLADGLAKTGGPLTKRERAWADQILRGPRWTSGRRKKAA